MSHQPTYKPGYKSSEFWTVLASFIFSGLFLLGIFTEKDQADELSNIAAHGIESCILICGQLFILYRYVAGRSRVKALVAQKSKEETDLKLLEKTSERKPSKTRKSRTTRNSSKSSKSTKRRTTKTRKPKTSGDDQE